MMIHQKNAAPHRNKSDSNSMSSWQSVTSIIFLSDRQYMILLKPSLARIPVVVQLLSRVRLCSPTDCSSQTPLSSTISQSLLKLMSIEPVMPSNHLILCRPLLLLRSVFPSIRVLFNELALPIRWPNYLTLVSLRKEGISDPSRSSIPEQTPPDSPLMGRRPNPQAVRCRGLFGEICLPHQTLGPGRLTAQSAAERSGKDLTLGFARNAEAQAPPQTNFSKTHFSKIFG